MTKINKHSITFNIRMQAKHETLSELNKFIENELKVIENKRSLNEILLIKVNELELSTRVEKVLKYDNVIYIGDLIKMTQGELLRTPNFGKHSLNEIKNVLKNLGLYLDMKNIKWPPKSIPFVPVEFDGPLKGVLPEYDTQ